MNTFRKTWQLYRRHWLGLMLMLLINLLFCAICAAPLLGLITGQAPLMALLSPVLFALVLLPVRQNTAKVYRALIETDSLYIGGIADPEHYLAKVLLGLKTTLCMVLWSLPWLAATGYAVYVFIGDPQQTGMDVFSLMRSVISIGGGSFTRGIVTVVVLYLATLLPILLGLAVHSCRRHFAAWNMKPVRRIRLALLWLAGLVTVVPFAAVTAATSMDYVKQLMQAVNNLMNGFHLPPLSGKAYIILGAFVVLMLPLVPLKNLLTAVGVARQAKRSGS